MAKRKSKVPEKIKEAFSFRIKEFAGAIHSYGIEKLYDKLVARAYINATYPIETFRTDFKRMKSGGNGLLNEPSLLGGILEILHFPADALFGGPTSHIEDTRKIIEKTVSNALQNFKKQWNAPQKRIYGPRIIDRACQVYCIIENMVQLRLNGYIPVEPIMSLFVWYSSQNKAWNHEQEKRIMAILEKILSGAKGYTYYYYQYFQFNPQVFTQDIIRCDNYWNLCLIIAYQLSCIESIYSLFNKSKTIKRNGPKKQFATIFLLKVSQNITPESENPDIFAYELNNFCEVFDKLFKTDIILNEFFNRLVAIIQNLQKILLILLTPTKIDEIQKNSMGNSPVYNFIRPENIFEIHYELKITDNEIDILKKSINILRDQNFPLDNQNNATMHNEQQSDNLSENLQGETQKSQKRLGNSLSPPAMPPDTETAPNKNQPKNLEKQFDKMLQGFNEKYGNKKGTEILDDPSPLPQFMEPTDETTSTQ